MIWYRFFNRSLVVLVGVFFGIHHHVQLFGFVKFHFKEPAFIVRRRKNLFGFDAHGAVDFDDAAGERRDDMEQLIAMMYGYAVGVDLQFVPDHRKIDAGQFVKFFLDIFRNADDGNGVGGVHPYMGA